MTPKQPTTWFPYPETKPSITSGNFLVAYENASYNGKGERYAIEIANWATNGFFLSGNIRLGNQRPEILYYSYITQPGEQ